MNVRDAVVRGLRTAAQTVVGITLVLAPIVNALPDGFKVGNVDVRKVTSFAFSVLAALAVGLTSFATNLAEDNTRFQLPK